MNFRQQLLGELSRRNTDYVANAIGNDPDLFRQVWDLLFIDHPKIPQRAAWVVEECAARYPELIAPYLSLLIDAIKTSKHSGIRRCLLKILSYSPCPEERTGEVVDMCFNYMLSGKEPVAIKVFSMSVLANIVQNEPDIKTELLEVIRSEMPKNSAGFKSRGKKIIQQLTNRKKQSNYED